MKEKIKKELQLCSEQGCCPTIKFVERDGKNIIVIEDDYSGRVELKENEWNDLKSLIVKGEG